MDLLEAIINRCSVRRYRSEAVSEESVTKILELASQAPSAGNLQPWHFIVVRDSKRKIALAKAALGQSMVANAPLVIVVCADQLKSRRYYGERGANLFCIQDTAAAIENLLLAAFMLGIGTCWVGSFNESEVSEILHAPEGIRPIAIIPLGYPAEHPIRTSRKPLSEIVQNESF